jgi:hypothetical protein
VLDVGDAVGLDVRLGVGAGVDDPPPPHAQHASLAFMLKLW